MIRSVYCVRNQNMHTSVVWMSLPFPDITRPPDPQAFFHHDVKFFSLFFLLIRFPWKKFKSYNITPKVQIWVPTWILMVRLPWYILDHTHFFWIQNTCRWWKRSAVKEHRFCSRNTYICIFLIHRFRLFIVTEEARARERKWNGVDVMKDKELKLEKVQAPHVQVTDGECNFVVCLLLIDKAKAK